MEHQQATDKRWHKNKLNRFDVDLYARAAIQWHVGIGEWVFHYATQADVMFSLARAASLKQIENSFRLKQDRWIRGMRNIVLISCLHVSTVLSRLLLNTANKVYIFILMGIFVHCLALYHLRTPILIFLSNLTNESIKISARLPFSKRLYQNDKWKWHLGRHLIAQIKSSFLVATGNIHQLLFQHHES